MADYTRREEVKRTIVYSLPNPTNWAEVSKVFAVIKQEMTEHAARYDDTVVVTHADDWIEVRFDAEYLAKQTLEGDSNA
jgi:hypothetical protein